MRGTRTSPSRRLIPFVLRLQSRRSLSNYKAYLSLSHVMAARSLTLSESLLPLTCFERVGNPTRMRPPVVKRQSNSLERNLVHFFRLTMPAFETELTLFPYAGANETCLHHTRIEVLSPRGGDCTEPVVALAT